MKNEGVAIAEKPISTPEPQQELEIFLFTITSKQALASTQPPIQWVPGAPSLWVKQLGCETDHLPLSSDKVKNARRYISTPPIRLHGVVLN